MLLAHSRLLIIAIPSLVDGYYRNKYVSAPEIAQKYNMNVRALMPALKQLTRAGILRSRVGGREPGFIFSRNPEYISLLQIMDVLEGEEMFTCCKDVIAGVKCDYEDKSKCEAYKLFNTAYSRKRKLLSEITIKEYGMPDAIHNCASDAELLA